jgi:hypothetical protein
LIKTRAPVWAHAKYYQPAIDVLAKDSQTHIGVVRVIKLPRDQR